MLRRFFILTLALCLAAPMPAAVAGGCSMDNPALGAAPCNCCDGPAGAEGSPCADESSAGCGCSIRSAAPQDLPSITSASNASAGVAVRAAVTLPASLCAPRHVTHAVHETASPPGLAPTARPMLCSWLI